MEVIGQDTGISIIVIIGFLGFMGGAVWWAASMNAKVTILVDGFRDFVKSFKTMDARIAELEARVRILETKSREE